ncbi:dolichyl-P-Man:Man(5)GlcNAc(2)-PP-dolichol alpha-1,3-mannosyltransferase [Marasmius sp. AFHP31]|nr:dolichyl-P-Man:Man(5)GlcNAc(2)-PP-dolichol alpha-1,3-mannosyltransferase [Marasmius sp. AFHP31]
MASILRLCRSLLVDPNYYPILAFFVVLGDAFLSVLIRKFIPYTEIDWETYMIQVQSYIKGQRDYSKISGPTGSLVYPAGHLWIHVFLERITNGGLNIGFAQNIYTALYILSLALSCAIYRKAGGVPNWILLLLPLSKRLHSIYILRLFNDCWSVVAMQCAILAFQSAEDDIGILFFSLALSVKMSILLYLPGLVVILVKRKGLLYTIRKLFTITGIQSIIAFPFIQEDWRAYLRSSFDLSRVFLYKWTVNWRMVPEEIFLHPRWATSLLIGHVSLLLLFGISKWCNPDGGVKATISRALRRPAMPAGLSPVSADFVATVFFTCNLIGVLFARSLHYQFYSWYAQQIPYLLSRTRYPVYLKIMLFVAIEYAWNTFPSTTPSSSILLLAHITLLAGIWFGFPCGLPPSRAS